MTYHVRPIQQKVEWEQFIATQADANFLHSWNWGVFHQQLGKPVYYLGLFDEAENQVGAALGVVESARRGRYLTIAGGPLIDQWAENPDLKELLAAFLIELKKIGQAEKCLFIRIRPQMIDTPKIQGVFQQLGFLESPMHVTADLTLQLDLTKSEEQLLQEMRKNTRYEVRKADKLGLTVTFSQDPAEIQAFYQQQVELAEKQNFVPFSYQFLYQQFLAFVQDNQVVLVHAWNKRQLLATAFVIFYNGEAVYHYGISTPENQKLPGSYACQWAAIQEAKRRGCSRYNFWGIAPQDQTHHRFAGVSLFKRGWGGSEVQYLPARDLPLHWLYTLTRSFELIRRKLRHLS